jgi:recombination protein RecT
MSASSILTSTQANKLTTIKDYFKPLTGRLSKVAGDQINPERQYTIFLNCLLRNPALLDCTPESLFRAVSVATELGWELIPSEAHLVPFGTECTLVPDYQGLISLCYRSGFMEGIEANAVYEGDEFEYQYGTNGFIKHIPKGNQDPAKMTYVYAICFIKGSSRPTFRVKDRAWVDKKKSQAKTQKVWGPHFAEMAIKSVIKNTLKIVPKSAQMSKALLKALAYDNAIESGEYAELPAHFDAFSDDVPKIVTPKKGVEAVKAKVGANSAPLDDAALVAFFKLTTEQERELRDILSQAPDGPSFAAFLAAAKTDGKEGFGELLEVAKEPQGVLV